jgi:hypothetical protein
MADESDAESLPVKHIRNCGIGCVEERILLDGRRQSAIALSPTGGNLNSPVLKQEGGSYCFIDISAGNPPNSILLATREIVGNASVVYDEKSRLLRWSKLDPTAIQLSEGQYYQFPAYAISPTDGSGKAMDNYLGQSDEAVVSLGDKGDRGYTSYFFFFPQWDFAGISDSARSDRLKNFVSPYSVLKEVFFRNQNVWGKYVGPIKLGDVTWEPGKDEIPADYRRAVVKLSVPPESFDLIWNSPGGLRGQYYMEPVIPGAGSYMNRVLIELLTSELQQADAMVKTSLSDPSAKIWMDEALGLPIKAKDAPLEIPRWKGFKSAKSGDPIVNFLGQSLADIIEKATWGTLAPIRNGLEIKGAWVNAKGETLVADSKRTRSKQIAYLGFS